MEMLKGSVLQIMELASLSPTHTKQKLIKVSKLVVLLLAKDKYEFRIFDIIDKIIERMETISLNQEDRSSM